CTLTAVRALSCGNSAYGGFWAYLGCTPYASATAPSRTYLRANTVYPSHVQRHAARRVPTGFGLDGPSAHLSPGTMPSIKPEYAYQLRKSGQSGDVHRADPGGERADVQGVHR